MSRLITMIFPSKTETPLKIKLLLIVLLLCWSTRLELSALLSLQIKVVLRNSTWSRCGNHQTAPSVTNWTALFSVSQSWFLTYLDLYQAGLNQLWLVDTHMVTNTEVRMVLPPSQARSRLFSLQLMAQNQLANLSTNSLINLQPVAT